MAHAPKKILWSDTAAMVAGPLPEPQSERGPMLVASGIVLLSGMTASAEQRDMSLVMQAEYKQQRKHCRLYRHCQP